MEIVAFLLIVAIVLVLFKLLAIIFKAGILLLSIPLQIFLGIFIALLLFILLPIGVIAGLLALIFSPLLFFGPLLPILLILVGIYLLVRR